MNLNGRTRSGDWSGNVTYLRDVERVGREVGYEVFGVFVGTDVYGFYY